MKHVNETWKLIAALSQARVLWLDVTSVTTPDTSPPPQVTSQRFPNIKKYLKMVLCDSWMDSRSTHKNVQRIDPLKIFNELSRPGPGPGPLPGRSDQGAGVGVGMLSGGGDFLT